MLYLLDTADLDAIRHCNEFYPLDGVTTNPSILARSGGDFWQTVCAIRAIIGPEKALHVQTRGITAEQMVEEGKLLREKLGGEFYLKIPVCEEGLKATMMLKQLGIGVTVTAIFTPAQALMAAKAGADFVAPYVNRLDSIGADGAQVVADIVEEFAVHGMATRVLAASFKNVQQVHNCALSGCHSVTATADILKALISHPMTDKALEGFDADWNAAFGDKTILEL